MRNDSNFTSKRSVPCQEQILCQVWEYEDSQQDHAECNLTRKENDSQQNIADDNLVEQQDEENWKQVTDFFSSHLGKQYVNTVTTTKSVWAKAMMGLFISDLQYQQTRQLHPGSRKL